MIPGLLQLRCTGCGNAVFTSEMPLDQIIMLDEDNRYCCGYCGNQLGLKK